MKRKLGRKLLSILLTLGLVLGLMPGMSLTAYAATNYDLWIGGTQVTSDNLSGTGWSYDAGTKTLTLDGYSNNGAGYSWTDNGVNFAPIYAKQDLTLLLKGSNSITGPQTPADYIYPIYIDGNLSIAGNGMLNANGSDTNVVINCGGDITIEGGTVYANAIDYGIWCNNITIEGGTVNLTVTGDCSRGIWANNDVTIKSGSVTTKSTYDSGALSDGILGKKITIEGGTIVASSVNGNGISAENDMTIKGGNVTATGSSYGIGSDEGLTIEGGTVTADTAASQDSVGIMGATSVNISGGTVAGTGDTAGIGSAYVIIINGGDVTASGTTNGLYTRSGYYIIGDGLEAKAGTSAADAGYLNITPLEQHKSCDDLKSYFNLSSDTHWNYLDTGSLSGKQWARVASHIHNFTFSASGDTVTGICSANGCELPLVDGKRTATLTIKAPTTDDGKAVLEGNPASAIGDLSGKIKYQTKNGSAWGSETTTAPTEAGIHRASITLGGKTASVTYGVNCITYATGLVNGSVSGATDAACGATVTPTITPAAGYQLDTLTVTPEAGSGIGTVTVDGGTFVMPEANVTVSATFKQITYTVTVDGGIATVTDSTPEQNTYTAELTGLPSDKDYDGNMIALSATVRKSEGFPSQVAVGNVSFRRLCVQRRHLYGDCDRW